MISLDLGSDLPILSSLSAHIKKEKELHACWQRSFSSQGNALERTIQQEDDTGFHHSLQIIT
jgi:hypothetical protein